MPILIFVGVIGFGIWVNWWLDRTRSQPSGPVEEAGGWRYRLRPSMKVICLVACLGGLGMLAIGIRLARFSWIGFAIFAALSLPMFGLAAMQAGGSYFLSSTGLHYRRWGKPDVVMVWAEMSHYEVMENRRGPGGTYYIRAKGGGDGIAVGDTAFDAQDMMRRIETRVKLKKEPYVRRKWYGG